jgi:SAM-dependent methyltransferase
MRGCWLREGIEPLPSPAGDKAVDREALQLAGGLGVITGKRVLEIGPCYGLDARDFAPLAALYVVVDLDELVFEWLRGFAPRAAPILADARLLPCRGAQFDTVLDFGSLDNTGHPEQGYEEACRVLRPGGVLVSTYGNAAVLGRGAARLLPPDYSPGEFYSYPQELVWLLESQGLTVACRAHENQPRAIMVAWRTDNV